MRLAVHASRHAADDDDTRRGEVAAERSRDRPTVRRAGPRADDARRPAARAAQARRLRGSTAAAADRGSLRGAAGSAGRNAQVRLVIRPAARAAHGTRALRRCAPARPTSASRERCDRPRHARDTNASPTRQRQPLDSAVEQLGCGRGPPCWRPVEALPGRKHPLAHGCRGLSRRSRELGRARSRHRDDEVEAVEQGARDLLLIRADPLRRAAALGRRIATPSARAHVHRADERETAPGRGPHRRPARPRRTHPRAAAATPRELHARTPAARRAAERRGGRGSPHRVAARCRRRRWPPPRRRDAARETAGS